MADQEDPNAAEETQSPEDVSAEPSETTEETTDETAEETVDAGEAAQESIDAAQQATDEIEEGASDPATPVDEEMDEKTAAALKAAQEAIASLNTPDEDSSDAGGDDASAGSLSDDDIIAQMTAQMADEGASQSVPEGQPFSMPVLEKVPGASKSGDVELLSDVNLKVKIELGRTKMFVEDVLKLSEGAVVELDKAAGDPVDIYVNERPVARGEVLVINDCFCVRISEIISSQGKRN